MILNSAKNYSRKFVLGASALLLAFAVVGCSKDELKVDTYKAAKPVAAVGAMAQQMPAQNQAQPAERMPSSPGAGAAPHGESAPPAFGWDVPSGWSLQPSASAMRVATFVVPGGDAKNPFQTSVLLLGGDAGGLIANVNRWRQQVGLGEEQEAAIRKVARSGKSRLGQFQWFEIVNKDQGMLIAVVPAGEGTLFVKLVAPQGILTQNQAKFLSLCRSLRKA